jgi:hypothetical protein
MRVFEKRRLSVFHSDKKVHYNVIEIIIFYVTVSISEYITLNVRIKNMIWDSLHNSKYRKQTK